MLRTLCLLLRSTRKTVPLFVPQRLRKRILPPWFWMISLLIHSPNPVPTSFLVVKNGSKHLRPCCFGDAGPVIGNRDLNPVARSF